MLEFLKQNVYWREKKSADVRIISINDISQNKFISNEVTTSRYTILNFIPKNLWRQFHKISNVYFLFIGILQLTPSISTTNGFPTIFAPLVFVLFVNALKDACEDWGRHKVDAEENQQTAYVVVPFRYVTQRQQTLEREIQSGTRRSKKLSLTHLVSSIDDYNFDCSNDDAKLKKPHFPLPGDHSRYMCKPLEQLEEEGVIVSNLWKHLSVGDIVLCRNHEKFPADLILLSSNDKHGITMVDTASLDGETNLKMRQAHPELASMFRQNLYVATKTVASFTGKLKCSVPDGNLKHFEGVLKLKSGNWQSEIPLTDNQLLLRGCKLRNTAWILGIVVYSGKETKIQMVNKYSK